MHINALHASMEQIEVISVSIEGICHLSLQGKRQTNKWRKRHVWLYVYLQKFLYLNSFAGKQRIGNFVLITL